MSCLPLSLRLCCTVQTSRCSVTVLQIRGTYSDVKVATLYDVLHDPVYRKTWDPNILEGQEICRIDANNDIGYYASAYMNDSVQQVPRPCASVTKQYKMVPV